MRLLLLFLLIPTSLLAQVSPSSLNDTINISEVTVTQKRQVSGMLSGNLSLSADNLSSIPAFGGAVDVLKVLELMPSMRTSGDANSNIYVRGGDAGQNRILYGGAAIYTPGHAINIFPLFNADHLSSLALSKGNAAAEHGNFLSAVIDVKPKARLADSLLLKGSVGLLSSQLTVQLPIGKRWTAYASARKTYLNQVLRPFLQAGGESNMNYDFWDANFTLVGKLSEKHRLQIDAFSGLDDLDISEETMGLAGQIRWRNAMLSAQLHSQFSAQTKLEQQVYYSGFRNQLFTEQVDYKIDLNSTIEDFTYQNKLSFSAFRQPIDAGMSFSHYRLNPYDLLVENLGNALSQPENMPVSANYFSAFLATKLHGGSRWMITPTVRYNYFASEEETEDFQSFDFRLAAQYQAAERLFLRANFSHNNQYLNKLTPSSVGLPTDFWVAANAQIPPQSGNEYALGAFHYWADGQFELSADVYYRTMENATQYEYNFIENEQVSFVDKIEFGTGRAYGAELMLKKNAGRWSGWLSYAWGKSERQFEAINEGAYFPAKFDRRHDFSATVQYQLNAHWDLSLTQIFATGNTYTQPTSWYFINSLPVKEYTQYNNARLPNYNRTDIGANYWFNKNSRLNFSIYNAFNIVNPIYVFLDINENEDTGELTMSVKNKTIYRIIPSISWHFKF